MPCLMCNVKWTHCVSMIGHSTDTMSIVKDIIINFLGGGEDQRQSLMVHNEDRLKAHDICEMAGICEIVDD